MSRNKAIFFDIDDTLIATKSMFDFQSYYYAHACEYRHADPKAVMSTFRQSLAQQVPDGCREDLNRAFYRSFEGRSLIEVETLAEEWFATLPASVWIEPALALLRKRRDEGYLIVGVSGSSHEILSGINSALRFDHLLAAQLEVSFGLFTGELIPPQTIGEGKAIAIRQLADAHDIDLQSSAACGDHISDLAMLECVGEQIIVTGDPLLEKIARDRGWVTLTRAAKTDAEVHV
ncbi:MAG: HAD-IB family hydrolase [Pseudomonadota bacterium]|nr:HAD-IB family hydrolase [Pseudomonadota bacterium]